MSEQVSSKDIESLFKINGTFTEISEENKENLKQSVILTIVTNREEILETTGKDYYLNPSLFISDVIIGDEYKSLSLYLKELFTDTIGFTRGNIGDVVRQGEFIKLNYKYKLLKAISEITMDFDQISKEEFGKIVDNALELIGQAIYADRIYVFEFFNKQEKYRNTHEWVNSNENIKSYIDQLIQLNIDDYPYLKEKMMNEEIMMTDVEDLKNKDPNFFHHLTEEDIKSLVLIPFRNHDRVRGFIGIDSVEKKHTWTEDEMEVLKNLSDKMTTLYNRFESRIFKQYRDLEMDILKIGTVAETENELFEKIHELVKTKIPSDNFFVAIQEGDAVTFPYFKDRFDENPGKRVGANGITEWLFKNDGVKVLSIKDISKLTKEGKIDSHGTDSNGLAGVAFTISDNKKGAVVVQVYGEDINSDHEYFYDEHQANLLEVISKAMSQTMRRFELDKEVAKARRDIDQMFQHMPLAMFSIDGRGRFNNVSPYALKETGYIEEDLKKSFSFVNLFPEDQRHSIVKYIQDLKKGIKTEDNQFNLLCKDGTEKPVKIMAEILKDEKNNLEQILGFAFDMTVINNFIQKIEEQKNKLMQTEIELSASIKVKDTFFHTVAHDLKNPIGAILSLSEISGDEFKNHSKEQKNMIGNIIDELSSTLGLLDTGSGAIRRSLLKVIEMLKNIDAVIDEKNDNNSSFSLAYLLELISSGSKKAVELIGNLLEYARVQSGSRKFEKELISLSDIALFTCDLNSNSAERKEIKLINNISGKMEMFIDHQTIEFMLRNLIMNSIKFTPNGGTITINYVEDEDFNTVIIEDNGVGISAEEMKHIFDEKEIYTTRGTDGEEGTGFGLKNIKAYCELQDGKFIIESEKGKGSKFKIVMPKKKS